MPWVERLTPRCGLKGRESVGPAFQGRRLRSQSFELFLRWPTTSLSASVRARRNKFSRRLSFEATDLAAGSVSSNHKRI